jgi:hypothetical protein
MSASRRIAAALGVAVAALAVGAGRAGADPTTGGANAVVVARTTTDGAWLVRSSTEVASYGGDTLTSANLATATASGCTACHSTAVAVQVVFATGTPSYFAPANAAVATTAGCTDCGTYAYAWQYVIDTGGPVVLSPATQAAVASLRQQIAAAAGSLLPSDAATDPTLANDQELDARLDALTTELKDLIDANLQSAGVPATGVVFRHVQDAPAG